MMVSILMCTYNRENYLARAIGSVLAQTFKEWELIIVDDGSTDRSREVVLSYQDGRITYIPLEQNRFYCYAANYGLPYCTGEYIAFLNSDDEWLPDKLEKQVTYLERNRQYGACFTEVTLIDNAGADVSETCIDMTRLFATHYETQAEWMRFFLFCGNSLCHPSAVIRKDIIDEVGGFNLMYYQLADYDLWIRIVSSYPIYVIPERLIKFRWDIEKKEQVSSATELHTIRSFNEQALIREQMIERLSDEQFICFYQSEFRNPSSHTHLELEFEKAFLLMRCISDAPKLKILGIRKIEKVLQEERAVEALEEHFHTRIQDIYEWDQEHWYADPIIQRKIECYQQKKQEAAELAQEVGRLRKLISEYHTSTSWRCTAPFRKTVRIIKRLIG